MTKGVLGRIYQDGEVIVRQGDVGESLFVIQDGQVEIAVQRDGKDILVGLAGKGELIGEMAIFEKTTRCATVRARGPARVLTIDKKNFLRRMTEDPSLAFRIVETMSRRVRELDQEIARLKAGRPAEPPSTPASFAMTRGPQPAEGPEGVRRAAS